MLPERAPSAITGRDLAAEAGVNYGLVHHHFGGKDGALEAGLRALREQFIDEFGNGVATPFLGLDGHPYLRAVVRSQIDYPDSVHVDAEFPIGRAMVTAIAERLGGGGADDSAVVQEAKARTIAGVSLQVCYAVFGAMLLDTAGVNHRERADVEAQLASIYESLVARTRGLDSN